MLHTRELDPVCTMDKEGLHAKKMQKQDLHGLGIFDFLLGREKVVPWETFFLKKTHKDKDWQ